MPKKIKIDFVSDVACPWCAVGLGALEQALDHLKGEIEFDLHFQPFELNPNMPKGGQDTVEHLMQKYGSTPEQVAKSQEQIKARAEAVGFPFAPALRKRVYNTFNCHRLLHWAGHELGQEEQHRLKKELLITYFTRVEDLDDPETLLKAVDRASLDRQRATVVLSSDEFAEDVRASQAHYASLGIAAVPTVIFNDQYLLQGGQPTEMFEQALRQLMEE